MVYRTSTLWQLWLLLIAPEIVRSNLNLFWGLPNILCKLSVWVKHKLLSLLSENILLVLVGMPDTPDIVLHDPNNVSQKLVRGKTTEHKTSGTMKETKSSGSGGGGGGSKGGGNQPKKGGSMKAKKNPSVRYARFWK